MGFALFVRRLGVILLRLGIWFVRWFGRFGFRLVGGRGIGRVCCWMRRGCSLWLSLGGFPGRWCRGGGCGGFGWWGLWLCAWRWRWDFWWSRIRGPGALRGVGWRGLLCSRLEVWIERWLTWWLIWILGVSRVYFLLVFVHFCFSWSAGRNSRPPPFLT